MTIDVLDLIALYAATEANVKAGAVGPFGAYAPAWHHHEGADAQYGMKDFPSPAIQL